MSLAQDFVDVIFRNVCVPLGRRQVVDASRQLRRSGIGLRSSVIQVGDEARQAPIIATAIVISRIETNERLSLMPSQLIGDSSSDRASPPPVARRHFALLLLVSQRSPKPAQSPH